MHRSNRALPASAVVSKVHTRLLDWLRTVSSTVRYQPGATQADLLAEPVTSSDVLVLRSNVRVRKTELDHMPNLKLVARAGSGTDNLDLTELARRGVEVLVAGGEPSGPAVAELAVQAAISLLRRVPGAAMALAEGRWEKDLIVGREVASSRVGVWGAGPVGRAVAQRFRALGAQVGFLSHPTKTCVGGRICTYCRCDHRYGSAPGWLTRGGGWFRPRLRAC